MTVLEVPALYERFYWRHHDCYHSASRTHWLVKMWVRCGQHLMLSCEQQSFSSSYQVIKLPLECYVIFTVWLSLCWKPLKVSMQSFSLQNTILQSWWSAHSFFFFWTLVVVLHIVNSLMVKAAEWNEHWNGMNIEPKLAKKLNFCEGFYLIIPTN